MTAKLRPRAKTGPIHVVKNCRACGCLFEIYRYPSDKVPDSCSRSCGARRGTLSERFWSKVDKTGDCWIWTSTIGPGGYGYFGNYETPKARNLRAHRVAWELTNGPIEGPHILVCHKCDNPPCVNPDHLFLGTAKDNAQDAVRKGRLKPPRQFGEANRRSKLTPDKVRHIRVEHSAGKSIRVIARHFGIAPTTVQQVLRRRTWGHVR